MSYIICIILIEYVYYLLMVIFSMINKRFHNITQHICNIMIRYIDIFGDLHVDNIIISSQNPISHF